jgi:hypothetical protein
MELVIKYVGHGAQLETPRGRVYARLDFITGRTMLFIRLGFIMVQHHCELHSFVESLSSHLHELNRKLALTGKMECNCVEWSFGNNKIGLVVNANAERAIKRFANLLTKIEDDLESAEVMSLRYKGFIVDWTHAPY